MFSLIRKKCINMDFSRSVLFSDIKIWVPDLDNSELPALWWDAISDKCLLLGVFKHGKKPYIPFVSSLLISSNSCVKCVVGFTVFIPRLYIIISLYTTAIITPFCWVTIFLQRY